MEGCALAGHMEGYALAAYYPQACRTLLWVDLGAETDMGSEQAQMLVVVDCTV